MRFGFTFIYHYSSDILIGVIIIRVGLLYMISSQYMKGSHKTRIQLINGV